MDTSNPSPPKGKSINARSQGRRTVSEAYWIILSTKEEAAPFAEEKNGKLVINERGRKVADTWKSLGEGRPSLKPDSVSIGPHSIQGIVRLMPGLPNPVSLPEAMRLFKTLASRSLGAAPETGEGIWKKGYAERALTTLKQVVEARSALKRLN